MLIISLYLACGSWTKVKREMLGRFKEAACNLLTLGAGIQPSEDGPFHIFILDSVSWIRRSIGRSASSSCDNSGGSWIVGSGAGVTDIALFTSTSLLVEGASPGGDAGVGADGGGGAGTTLGVRLMISVFFRSDALVAHVFSKTSWENVVVQRKSSRTISGAEPKKVTHKQGARIFPDDRTILIEVHT